MWSKDSRGSYESIFFLLFFSIYPLELLPVLGQLEQHMTPTLDAALLYSSRVGSDLGRKSDRFEELCQLGFPHSQFYYWAIDIVTPRGIRSTVSWKHQIYWMKNKRLNQPSHHGWILRKLESTLAWSRGKWFKSKKGRKLPLSPFWVAISWLLFTFKLFHEYAKWSINWTWWWSDWFFVTQPLWKTCNNNYSTLMASGIFIIN